MDFLAQALMHERVREVRRSAPTARVDRATRRTPRAAATRRGQASGSSSARA